MIANIEKQTVLGGVDTNNEETLKKAGFWYIKIEFALYMLFTKWPDKPCFAFL